MNTQKANDERRYHALEFGCGWGAGCIETCIVYPATKVSFRQQVHGYNVLGAIREIRAEGISLLYRGLLPPLLMRTTSRAVMFGLYDNFLTHFGGAKYTRGSSLFTVERAKAAFLAGACEASLAPLERIQVLLQADKYHKEFKNSGDAAVKIFKYYGIREYYRGISLVIARNGLSNILYFNLREPFKMFILDKSKIESHTALQ
ncbi:unnamed protein product, partial [Mesorhabditis belari]|uniref:Mitochondrial carrier protein n=1 Tax=Mesorhabditis belari TaxID=2138241 RepID=A0AAF3FPL4_9BILA